MNNKTKILHIVGSMNMGGIQVFIMNLFRNINREKYSFDFACMNPNNLFKNEITSLGGEIYWVDSRKQFLHHYKKLKKILLENEYECIHIHASHAFSVVDALIVRKVLPNSKILFHSHTTDSISVGLHKILKQLIPRIADKCLACSYEAGKWMFPKSVIRNKNYILIPNGINMRLYKYCECKNRRIRENLKIDDEQLIIGHIGRLDEPKNHVFLLDVFYEIQKCKSNAVLVLVGGRGNKTREVQNKVKQLHIENKVYFLGLRHDISDLLSVFDVFVFPSLYEGLPVSVIEAQAAGVPCVVSDTITEEVVLSPLINMVSLSKQPSEWAKVILCTYNDRQSRYKYCEMLEESNFNISRSIEIMENLYQ